MWLEALIVDHRALGVPASPLVGNAICEVNCCEESMAEGEKRVIDGVAEGDMEIDSVGVSSTISSMYFSKSDKIP